jgi:polyhydroxyalkanoate synthase subunit PhaC
MFCWYVRNTYLENKLREPGATVQSGVPVDLGAVDIPSFLYASRADHIVPWKAAYASTQLLGGERTFVLGASGHIAGVINPPAKKKRNCWVSTNGGAYDADPDKWLDAAESVPGSWWPIWHEWLAQTSGEKVAAPQAPGNDKYTEIEAAPGSYVKEKAPTP